MPDTNYRIGFLDIENTPNIGYTWGKYQQDVIAFTQEWYILAASWKWADESKPKGFILPDFDTYKKKPKDDKELCGVLWNLLNEADLIIGHNHVDFDLRKVNARMIYHGFKPPAPYKTVDTLKLARRFFALNSNKLGDLAEYLGVDHKMDPGGFKLWKACMDGDPVAWKKMKRYNVQDVVVLEQVYNRLRGWHTQHPNITLKDNPHTYKCGACGSSNVQRRGFEYMVSMRAQRYQCIDCGKWGKGTKEKIPGRILR